MIVLSISRLGLRFLWAMDFLCGKSAGQCEFHMFIRKTIVLPDISLCCKAEHTRALYCWCIRGFQLERWGFIPQFWRDVMALECKICLSLPLEGRIFIILSHIVNNLLWFTVNEWNTVCRTAFSGCLFCLGGKVTVSCLNWKQGKVDVFSWLLWAQPGSVRDNRGKCNEATGKQAHTITVFYWTHTSFFRHVYLSLSTPTQINVSKTRCVFIGDLLYSYQKIRYIVFGVS